MTRDTFNTLPWHPLEPLWPLPGASVIPSGLRKATCTMQMGFLLMSQPHALVQGSEQCNPPLPDPLPPRGHTTLPAQLCVSTPHGAASSHRCSQPQPWDIYCSCLLSRGRSHSIRELVPRRGSD